ncbi:TonB-dependent Receptor Plug Domain [Robiginitalea myxolifaciens]|uniref:TonB-dependent Receptor Plug Domain n=1 Tax=Robiginitalea myxolifaciens TaxID=400055 RepID=A0A1I6H3B2_9FLAO|nr:Plug domain-containing protein [Robiginitalea myxolifaciens]SFR48857.1 TonB-dependent Receptor Plug Domain [Robiginitalea myxolifaciens]
MQKRIFTLLFALCGANLFLTAQYSEPEEQASWIGAAETLLQSQEVIDSLINWEERIYLHTDRLEAQAGDYIFFKAYAMTGPRKLRVSQSKVLRVDLLDTNEELLNSYYYPLEAGTAGGSIPIPDDLDPETYTIKAYTRWMQNYGKDQYFSRQIRITDGEEVSSSSQNLAQAAGITFYPEGGQLIAGVNNKLVIRASDANGNPVSWNGTVRDDQGKTISRLENYAAGLGMITYTPQSGANYELVLENGAVYALPNASDQGVSLRVNSLESDGVRLRIHRVGNQERLYLVGKRGDRQLFEQEIEFQRNGQADLEIPKNALPVGLLTFEVRNEEEAVKASRPVHIEVSKALNLELVPTRQNLNQGGENEYTVKLTDADGNPVQTEISLAITRNEQASQPNLVDMLRPVPASADVGVVRKSLFLEDLRLLASSDQDQISTYPEAIEFPVQTGLELIGYVYDLNNELLRNTEVQVMSSTDEDLFISVVETDGSGILKLDEIDFAGEVPLIFRTKGEDTKSSLVRFEQLHDEIFKKKIAPLTRKKNEVIETTPWAVIDTTGLIQLAETTVTAKKKEVVNETPSTYGIKLRKVVRQDPNKPAISFGDLLQRVPGIYVSGDIFTSPNINVIGAPPGPIRWVVDGLLLVANQDPYDLVPITDVERIEVLSNSDASIYGSRGTGAILAVYTRSGSGGEYIRRKDAMITFKGFESSLTYQDYLEYRQDNRKLRKQQPATLYWNPNIQTDANGEAVVRFTSPGDYEAVRIEAQALTQDGQPGALNVELNNSLD